MAGQTFSLQDFDYIVAILILVVPVVIGIGYAIKDANKATRSEYFVGGRQMSPMPVAASLFITFQSAISLIGYPTEVCYYGYIYVLLGVGYIISAIISCFTIVPVMYPLQITSIYEYLKLRYDSETVRLFSSCIGMLTTVFYMAIVLLTPALALEAAAGVPLWVSIALIGSIGTLYTALGGIKSVIWTDAFQTIIVFIGIVAIIITGCLHVGGIQEVWRLSKQGERIDFNRFTPDPRVRHSVWGLVFGMAVMWLVNCFNQACLQRICCTRSLRDARAALLSGIPFAAVYFISLTFVGLVMYAYISFNSCDPFEAGFIKSRNQLSPYFVLDAMTDLPGMAGLYISTLCCGSLSTLSSGLNSLAANTVEDVLRQPLASLREATITSITKLIVFIYGGLIIGLSYLANSLDGPVTQIANTIFGCFGSPILGIFLMGGAVPWTNKYGAMAGAAASLTFNLWVGIGSRMQKNTIPTLPSPGTDGCYESMVSPNSSSVNKTVSMFDHPNGTSHLFAYSTWENTTSAFNTALTLSKSETFFLYDISYEWYCTCGVLICLLVGLIASSISNRVISGYSTTSASGHMHPRYIFPFLRRVWNMEAELPSHIDAADFSEPADIIGLKDRDLYEETC